VTVTPGSGAFGLGERDVGQALELRLERLALGGLRDQIRDDVARRQHDGRRAQAFQKLTA
jgi:hypothetical protein